MIRTISGVTGACIFTYIVYIIFWYMASMVPYGFGISHVADTSTSAQYWQPMILSIKIADACKHKM